MSAFGDAILKVAEEQLARQKRLFRLANEVTREAYDAIPREEQMDEARLEDVQRDNMRLRELLKKAEWGTEFYCPWCNAKQEYEHGHYPECSAFTASGDIR